MKYIKASSYLSYKYAESSCDCESVSCGTIDGVSKKRYDAPRPNITTEPFWKIKWKVNENFYDIFLNGSLLLILNQRWKISIQSNEKKIGIDFKFLWFKLYPSSWGTTSRINVSVKENDTMGG